METRTLVSNKNFDFGARAITPLAVETSPFSPPERNARCLSPGFAGKHVRSLAKGSLECVSLGPGPAAPLSGSQPGTGKRRAWHHVVREPGSADAQLPAAVPWARLQLRLRRKRPGRSLPGGSLLRVRVRVRVLSWRELDARPARAVLLLPALPRARGGACAGLGTAFLSRGLARRPSPAGRAPQSPFDWGPHPLLHQHRPDAPGQRAGGSGLT